MKIQVREHPQNGVDNNSNGICFEKELGFDHSHKKNGMTLEGSRLVAHMIRESVTLMP